MEQDKPKTPPQNHLAAEPSTGHEEENNPLLQENRQLKDQLLKTQAELGRAFPIVQHAQATDHLHRRLIAVIQEERVSPGLAMEALHRVELDLVLWLAQNSRPVQGSGF